MKAMLALLLSTLVSQAAGILLTWGYSESGDATGHRIYWGTNHGQFIWRESIGYTNSWRKYGFRPGLTYHFVATATNQFGESPYSNEADATVPLDAKPDRLLTVHATLMVSTNLPGPWTNYYEWPEIEVPATNQEHLFRIKMEIE